MAELVVALDLPGEEEALALVDRLGEEGDFYKVGLELFTAAGPRVVHTLRERGKRVFLDLKLHDIPNTVGRATKKAAALGVELLTVHTSGGSAMLLAAREGGGEEVKLLGVTLLTSLSPHEVEVAWGRGAVEMEEEVVRLAGMAADAGLHGVVASPGEARAIRQALGGELKIVTPGIRLPGGDTHDQTRVATPEAAVQAGADLLVVGRAVTGAADPREALQELRRRAL